MSKMRSSYPQQRGASLIMALFLVVGLALLGAVMSRMVVIDSVQSVDEWFAAQALYAAESAIDWGAHRVESDYFRNLNCPATAVTHPSLTITPQATAVVAISCQRVDDFYLYQIEASATSATARRTLTVYYNPSGG
jgi:Tfp pilus assembly protein PilX